MIFSVILFIDYADYNSVDCFGTYLFCYSFAEMPIQACIKILGKKVGRKLVEAQSRQGHEKGSVCTVWVCVGIRDVDVCNEI